MMIDSTSVKLPSNTTPTKTTIDFSSVNQLPFDMTLEEFPTYTLTNTTIDSSPVDQLPSNTTLE